MFRDPASLKCIPLTSQNELRPPLTLTTQNELGIAKKRGNAAIWFQKFYIPHFGFQYVHSLKISARADEN